MLKVFRMLDAPMNLWFWCVDVRQKIRQNVCTIIFFAEIKASCITDEH